MVAVILVLSAMGELSYGLFFAVSTLGLLIVAELSIPRTVTLQWCSRLRQFVALGLVGYSIVVIVRLDELLPIEVLPW